jgi:sialate O-acetylesterase
MSRRSVFASLRALWSMGVALFMAAGSAAPARADVALPHVIGSHMVLQQQSDVALWGTADAGEEVTVAPSWTKEVATTKAGADGRFRVKVKTPAAGGPFTITIRGKNTIELDDVLVGEVWLCGGQSNMEWAFAYGGVLDLEKERAAANDPQIRLCDTPNRAALAPESDGTFEWTPCTPESVNGFSCVGYFFARELRKALNVPVGLIGVNWGGTVAEAWVSEEGLARFPQFQPAIERVKKQHASEAAGGVAKTAADATAQWWAALDREDLGVLHGWAAPAFDDGGWEAATVPSTWSGELEKFDGVAWYRRAFEIPAALAEKELDLGLGAIDDMDQCFLDGEKIAGTESPGHWTEPRHYRITAAKATAGRHVLALRVVDTAGQGGLTGKPEEVRLAVAKGDASLPLAGEWKLRVGLDARRFPPLPADPQEINPNTPTVLWNGLVNPVVPFGVRGALWYQGESNRGRAAEYSDLMPALIADWRKRFERDLPFLFVQIAPFNYDGTRTATSELRQAQLQTLRVPNTGMAVTMDIGDPGNIHPANKQEVGRRLSLWALAMTYGKKDVECCGPLFESAAVEGAAMRVKFQHAKGLVAKDGAPKLFEVAGADGKFTPAIAKVDGETVVVASPVVKEPKSVRFGFTDGEATNLFNGAGLPASPFCVIGANDAK